MSRFFKKHYDKTAAVTAVLVVMLFVAPMTWVQYGGMKRNYHETVINQANIGSDMSEKILFEAFWEGINIWDTDYKKISLEEFRSDFCVENSRVTDEHLAKIADGRTARFHTAYDRKEKLEHHINCIQKAFRNANPFMVKYAEIMDRNGYVPWHGVANLKCIGNFEWDIKNNRTKRMWRQELSSAEQNLSNNRLFVHTTDYGERQNIAAASIEVGGRHWGWFLIAYNSYDHDHRVALQLLSMMFISALLVGAVFHVFILKTIDRIYRSHIVHEEESC